MTIEQRLKEYICLNYKSLRNFVNTSGVDMPYSTLDGILKRGIGKSSIDNVFKLCDALGISADALCNGAIIPKQIMNSKDYKEYDYIFEYMTIDDVILSEYEQFNMKKAFYDGAETVRMMRAMRNPLFDIVYRNDGMSAIINLETRQYRTLSKEKAEKLLNLCRRMNDYKKCDDYINGRIDEDALEQ